MRTTIANLLKQLQAIDQRLADVLQGSVSLFTGVGVAFYFGWRMAPIGVATAVVLVVLQSAVSQYIKHRAHKDIEVAEEMSRVGSYYWLQH